MLDSIFFAVENLHLRLRIATLHVQMIFHGEFPFERVNMHRILADLSRALNRSMGGRDGKSLCWSIAMKYGPDCVFCKFIGWVLRQPDHCRDEWTAQDTFDWLKSRK